MKKPAKPRAKKPKAPPPEEGIKNFAHLQEKISEFVYSEDDGMSRVAIAAMLSTRLKLGDPVWMLVIGQSSGGKSQLLRPLALTDHNFIHRVDDLTENTLLSGMAGNSLLKRIGSHGIIVISDLTVLFSKNQEARAAILSQFRMVYDGEMTKHSGNAAKANTWQGYIGIVAGSTPSVYQHFEEVADMGERFVYYRMKQYDVEKATRRSMSRKTFGKKLDEALAELYREYIETAGKKALEQGDVPPLSESTEERILQIALFAARLRTPAHYDKYLKAIDRVPVPEAPMRIALQLRAVALGLSVMNFRDRDDWELTEEDISALEWCAYSLANEERRASLRILAALSFADSSSTQSVADEIGLPTAIIGMHLQHLAAIGIVERSGATGSLAWKIKESSTWNTIRRIENLSVENAGQQRQATLEDGVSPTDDDDWGAFNEEPKTKE